MTAVASLFGRPRGAHGHGGPVLLDGLDAFDRMLLTTDGTVTTLLEACVGEEIATRTRQQGGPAALARLIDAVGPWWHPDADLLELEPDEPVVARRSILYGRRSRWVYVLGESLIAPARLPESASGMLDRAGSSIGRVLNRLGVETRREVVGIEMTRAGESSEHLESDPGTTLASRTYRIVIAGAPAFVISELLVPGRLAAASRRRLRML